jgi:hypothetical protein
MKAAEITEITETTGTTTSSCGRHPSGFRLFREPAKFPAAGSRFCSPAVRRRSFFLLLRRTPVRVGGIAIATPFLAIPCAAGGGSARLPFSTWTRLTRAHRTQQAPGRSAQEETARRYQHASRGKNESDFPEEPFAGDQAHGADHQASNRTSPKSNQLAFLCSCRTSFSSARASDSVSFC